MIRALTKFYASKKAALATAILGIILCLLSQLHFLPWHRDIHAVALGILIGLNGFSATFKNDWNQHGPLRGEFLSRAFFIACIAFLLIFLFGVVNEIVLKIY